MPAVPRDSTRIPRSPTWVRRAGLALLVAAVGAAAGSVCYGQETLRTWTDATGKYRIEASLIGQVGETVRLRRRDGATVELPLEKLSDADRQHLMDTDPANPFKVVPPDDNPFRPVAPPPTAPSPPGPMAPPTPPPEASPTTPASPAPAGSAPGEPTPSTSAPTAPDPPVPVASASASAGSTPAPAPPPEPDVPRPAVSWKTTPLLTAGPAVPPGRLTVPEVAVPAVTTAAAIPLAARVGTVESPAGLAVDVRTGTALVMTTVHEGLREPDRHRLFRVDLTTGRADPPREVRGGAYKLMAWDGRTGRMIVVEKAPRGFLEDLHLWRIDGETVERIVAIRGADTRGGDRPPKWNRATFLADDRLATVTDSDRLTVWTLPDLTARGTVKLAPTGDAAVSPDGRHVAVSVDKGARLIDARAPSIRGGAGHLARTPRLMDFSDDGTHLVLHDGQVIEVVNVRTGEATATIDYPHAVSEPVALVDPGHVWIGRTLLDVATGLAVCHVPGKEPVEAAGGRLWFVLAGGAGTETLTLVGADPAPPGTAERLKALAATGSPLILPPKSKIELDLSRVPDGYARDLGAALAERLAEAGHQAVDEADLVLAVDIIRGEKRQFVYTKMRPPSPDRPVGPRFGPSLTPFGPPTLLPGMGGLPSGSDPAGDILERRAVTIEPAVLRMTLRTGGAVWTRSHSQFPAGLDGGVGPLGSSITVPAEMTVEEFIDGIESPDWSTLPPWEFPRVIRAIGPAANRSAWGTVRVTSEGLQ